MLTLDGSTLEGGGQLVRVALALSAICSVPVHIHSIRANRARKGSSRPERGRGKVDRGGTSRPSRSNVEGGLKESHLAALVWLARHCEADVEGSQVGSTEVTFVPRGRRKGSKSSASPRSVKKDDTIELQNPGSVWLIFQALYPFMIFGWSNTSTGNDNDNHLELTLKGGTNVSKSMSAEYVQQVFLPTCQRIGLHSTSVTVVKRGWAGSAPAIGEVKIRVVRHSKSFTLESFDVTERGSIHKISISVIAEPESTRNDIISRLVKLIPTHLNLSSAAAFGDEQEQPAIEVQLSESSGDPRRLYILLVAHTANGWQLGRDFLGSGRTAKTNAEADQIVDNACQTVVRELAHEIRKGGCVDEYMQDQLVVFQALARGTSRVDGGANDRQREKVDATVEVGDENGSLHTRTVRWVAEKMLRKRGLRLETGGLCTGVAWNDERRDRDLKTGMEALSLEE